MNSREEMAKQITTAHAERNARSMSVSQHNSHYDTILSSSEESNFKSWKAKNAPNDSGEDYDLRGAFKEGFKRDPQSQHWDDKFKKPNHPTFSDQSQYAKEAPEKAGHWEGNKFISPKGKK